MFSFLLTPACLKELTAKLPQFVDLTFFPPFRLIAKEVPKGQAEAGYEISAFSRED